jgi:hypothetical protein
MHGRSTTMLSNPNPYPDPYPDPNSDPNPDPNPNPNSNQVHDDALAPRHPGDHTPRLLVERLRPSEGGESGIGGGGGVGGVVGSGGGVGDGSEFVTGRLLLSPWSAFKGIFPMHGTYFFQNEVFEDEGASEVLPTPVPVPVPLTLTLPLPRILTLTLLLTLTRCG